MYPNPSSGMLNIKTNIKDAELSIVDLSGRLIQYQKLEKYHTSLDVKHIRDGFYIVRVFNGDEKEERKLILKK